MKKHILLVFCLACSVTFTYAQKQYKRAEFDYPKMKPKLEVPCSNELEEPLKEAMDLMQVNQNGAAIVMLEAARRAHGQCPKSEIIYAEALFWHGKWLESNAVIDDAIQKFGPELPLVHARAYFCLQMADYGIATRPEDGNMAYLPASKQLPYDDAQFKKANLKYAVPALKFVYDKADEEPGQEILYLLALTYQSLEDYDKSNEALRALKNVPEYQNKATGHLIANLMDQKQYPEAEQELLALQTRLPRNAEVLRMMQNLYEKSGEKDKAANCNDQAMYFQWMGKFTTLPYSKANLESLAYFKGDHTKEEKLAALDAIALRPADEAIDLYIGILNMHANHGNGIENDVTDRLGKMGEPAVVKLIGFLQNASSTCGMSNAGAALAQIKDERGWAALVDFLPYLEQIGSATMVPEIPRCLVQFDKDRALSVLLPMIKERLERPSVADDNNPMSSLSAIFIDAAFYGPLDVYDKEVLAAKAKSMGFDGAQVIELLERAYPPEVEDSEVVKDQK
jgi:tetratricopeptide (TPR) repeat protein